MRLEPGLAFDSTLPISFLGWSSHPPKRDGVFNSLEGTLRLRCVKRCNRSEAFPFEQLPRRLPLFAGIRE
jgi:hypothetical protein